MNSFWTDVVPLLEIVSSAVACFFAIILTGKEVKNEGVELKEINGIPQYVPKTGLNNWGKFSRATLIITTVLTLALNLIKEQRESKEKDEENERLAMDKKEAQERYTNSITLQHSTLDSLRIVYDSINKSLEQQSLLQQKSDGILSASDQLTALQLTNLEKQRHLLFNTQRILDPFYPFRVEYSVGIDFKDLPEIIRIYLNRLKKYTATTKPPTNENLNYELLPNDSLSYIACRNLYTLRLTDSLDINYYMYSLLFYSMPTLVLKIQDNLNWETDVFNSLFSFSMDFSLTDSLARNKRESTSEVYVDFQSKIINYIFKRPVPEDYYIQNKLRSVIDLDGKYILAAAKFGGSVLKYKYLAILFHHGYNFNNRSLFNTWKSNSRNFFYHKIQNKDLNQTNFEPTNRVFTKSNWRQLRD